MSSFSAIASASTQEGGGHHLPSQMQSSSRRYFAPRDILTDHGTELTILQTFLRRCFEYQPGFRRFRLRANHDDKLECHPDDGKRSNVPPDGLDFSATVVW